MTIATDIKNFLGSLVVTQGPKAGELLEILPWQADFIDGLWKPGVYTSALSVARGNGKTTLIAAIAAAFIVGPARIPGGEVVIVASSFEQARIAFRHVQYFISEWIDGDRGSWNCYESANKAELFWKKERIVLKAKGSDPRRAHGLAPSLVLCDEPAQWPPNNAEAMVAALRTAMGKIGNEKMIALGTRPADPGHWFEQWLNGGCDFAQMHAVTDEEDPIFDRATILKANPSLDAMPALERAINAEIREIKDKGNPATLQSYKALRLNQGVAETTQTYLLTAPEWKACESAWCDREGACVWGVDLGATAAMSAIAAYWPESHALEVVAAFPADPHLSVRGNRDGVGDLYVHMANRKELIVTEGRTVQPGHLVAEALERFGPPVTVVSDRWRRGELMDAMESAGMDPSIWQPRGMGYKDGGEDVRRFRRAAQEGRIKTPESLLMRSAMGGAMTALDPAGNAKISKHSDKIGNQRHRDDAVVASVLAVAEGDRMLSAGLNQVPTFFTEIF